MNKLFLVLISTLTVTALCAQEKYLIDSIVTSDLDNPTIVNKVYFSYDENDRLIEKSTIDLIIKYNYPEEKTKVASAFSSSQPDQLIQKTEEEFDENDYLRFRSIFINANGELILTNLDTFMYNNLGELQFYSKHVITNQLKVLESNFKTYKSNPNLIDSSFEATYNTTTGDLVSSSSLVYSYDDDNLLQSTRAYHFDLGSYLIDTTLYSYYEDNTIKSQERIKYNNDIFTHCDRVRYLHQENKLTRAFETSLDCEDYERDSLLWEWRTIKELITYDSIIKLDNELGGTFPYEETFFNVDFSDKSRVYVTELTNDLSFFSIIGSTLIEKFYHESGFTNTDTTAKFAEIVMSPNPASSLASVQITSNQEFDQYQIYSEEGALIQSNFIANDTEIICQAPAVIGLYFISLLNNGEPISNANPLVVVE